MKFSDQMCNGVCVIRLQGENLDACACRVLEDTLLPKIPSDAPILIDVDDVQFADSAGLGLIRLIAREAQDFGFGLACVSRRLGKCLDRLPRSRQPHAWPSVTEGVNDIRRHALAKSRSPDGADVGQTKVGR